MSHPCLPAEIFVPEVALALCVPNVPEVSIKPFSLFIWEAKKLFAGLFGPDITESDEVFLPNKNWSPDMTASPSCALIKTFPEIGRVEGVKKPVNVVSFTGC